ncbi:hypothetical protein ACFOJE_17375 [Azotobacter bryophylli]|uniref:Uncharacterized protein n=1 Tax=Azotobacter bryophylli TaxID=1986537 RepID=A0ABV7AZ39_9GAMM
MLVLLNFQGNEQPVDLELLASNSGRIMDADAGLTHPTVPEDRSSLSRSRTRAERIGAVASRVRKRRSPHSML